MAKTLASPLDRDVINLESRNVGLPDLTMKRKMKRNLKALKTDCNNRSYYNVITNHRWQYACLSIKLSYIAPSKLTIIIFLRLPHLALHFHNIVNMISENFKAQISFYYYSIIYYMVTSSQVVAPYMEFEWAGKLRITSLRTHTFIDTIGLPLPSEIERRLKIK